MANPSPLHPRQDREAGLPAHQQGSRRVTAYVPEMALEICERIAEGETLTAICRTKDEDGNPTGMPAMSTFRRWVVNNPDLERAYMAAREMSAHSLEEEAILLGRAIKDNPKTSQQVRAYDILMNQLRWSASKRNPKAYGEHGVAKLVVPIQINTSLNLEEGASVSGDQSPESVYTIEGIVTVPEEGATPEQRAKALEQRKPVYPKPEQGNPETPKRKRGRPPGKHGPYNVKPTAKMKKKAEMERRLAKRKEEASE